MALTKVGKEGITGISNSSNANAITITSDENVGIGTDAAVNNANRKTLALQGAHGGQVDIMVGSVVHSQYGTDNFSTGLSARIQSRDGIVFKTGGATETMRINTNGGLITTPAAGGHAIFNEGSIDADFRVESNGNDHMIFVDGGSNVVNIGHATNTVGTSSGTLMVGFAGNTDNGIKLRDSRGESGTNNAIVFVRGDAAAGAITTTTAPATQYTTASDERLKENIADADDASSKIDTIKVRKFDWKNNGSHQDYGLIAQELRPIAPDAVAGDADSENMMSVDYAKLVPMMIKEIQSLRLRLKTLEENK